MSESHPFFSIVIPTRNEAGDIAVTLEAIRANTLDDYEVLVVDASEDDTPKVVLKFGDLRFQLLKQDNCDGRCGARNQGIRAALGEVVVILNADVRLPCDFLVRLKSHYEQEADFVIVEASVENWTHPFGAMVEAEHRYLYRSGREKVNWCEGYSCRRICALQSGLFPERLPVAMCAGEDAVFGENMARRFRRRDDPNMRVSHHVPEDIATFWAQRIGRGEGCSQRRILLDGWSFMDAFFESLWWSAKSFAWLVLFVPMLKYAHTLHGQLPEVPTGRFLLPLFLNRFGHEVGRWKGLVSLWHLRAAIHTPSRSE